MSADDCRIDYLVSNGNVFISHLYNGSKENKHYYYHRGWNIQAIFAYICGIALPFTGFVGTLGPHVSTSATNMGRLGWILSFVTSFTVYWIVCKLWPTRNQRLIKEMGLAWEEMGDREIIAEDGTVIVEVGSVVQEADIVGSGSDGEPVREQKAGYAKEVGY